MGEETRRVTKLKLIGAAHISADGRTVEFHLGNYDQPRTLVFTISEPDPVTGSRHLRVTPLRKNHGLKITAIGCDNICLEIDA